MIDHIPVPAADPRIDIIGVLYEPVTVIDRDNPPEPIALPGWHINVTPDLMDERPDLTPFLVSPSSLSRVWAGDDPTSPVMTIALRFTDEAEALTFFPA